MRNNMWDFPISIVVINKFLLRIPKLKKKKRSIENTRIELRICESNANDQELSGGEKM